MTVQVLMLMAGLGSRFAAAGYTVSKPLIPVRGTPMFAAALSSLAGLGEQRLTFVVRQQQIDEEQIDRRVREVVPDATCVPLAALTRGAAESALAAVPALEPDLPLIVLDCDVWFRSAAYERIVTDRAQDVDAAVVTFASSSPRYSYVALGPDGRAVDVAEKRVISEHAVAGAYYFRTVAGFERAARAVVAAGPREGVPEFYLSEVLRQVLAQGGGVLAAPSDAYGSLGTPDELAEYVARTQGAPA